MNTTTKTLLVALLGGMIIIPPLFAAERTIDFSKSPYVPGETVIGIDNWTSVGNPGGNVLNAKITDDHLLRLASTNYINIRNTFATPVTGPEVRVTFSIGWIRTSLTGETTQGVGMSLGTWDYGNTPVIINYKPSSGISMSTGSGVVTLLAAGDVQTSKDEPLSLYNFNIELDYIAKKFDIQMTGTNTSGSPVNVSYTEQTFLAGATNSTSLGSLYLFNNSTLRETYFGNISVVPEPSAFSLLILGGTALLGHRAWKSRRPKN